MTVPAPTPNYDALPGERWSTLRSILTSPLQYQWDCAHPRSETPAMLLGSAAHCAVLEPDEFPRRYAIRPDGIDRRTKAGKEDWAAFVALNAGRDILTGEQYEQCLGMRDAVRSNPCIAPLLVSGRAEVPMQWTDRETGIECKARADWVGRHLGAPLLADLKTTRTVELRQFCSRAFSLGYLGQLAYYRRGAVACGLLPLDAPVYLFAVEQEPPHDSALVEVGSEVMERGEQAVRDALLLLRSCRETDRWPGRYEAPQQFEVPRWACSDDDGPAFEIMEE